MEVNTFSCWHLSKSTLLKGAPEQTKTFAATHHFHILLVPLQLSCETTAKYERYSKYPSGTCTFALSKFSLTENLQDRCTPPPPPPL